MIRRKDIINKLKELQNMVCQTGRLILTSIIKKINLGRFRNKKDAIEARKQAEEKYFGEWSYDNSQERSI